MTIQEKQTSSEKNKEEIYEAIIPIKGYDSLKAGRKAATSSGFSFQTLSWSKIRESIRLIEEISVTDAEAADAVGNVVRLGNNGIRWLVVAPSEEYGRQAYDELETWSSTLFDHRAGGGINAFINYTLRQIVISGAGSAENKIEFDRSGVEDIYPVSVRSLDFPFSEKEDRYKIMQQQRKGDDVELDPLTYSYIPLATPLTGEPFPLPPLYAALEETQKLRDLLDAIKDGAVKQRIMGLLSLAIKRMAKTAQQSEDEWRTEQMKILDNVADEFSKALSEGLLVHFEDMKPSFLSFMGEAAKGISVTEPFEKRTSRALNFAWIREHGTIASAYMSIILEKILAEIQTIQLIPAQIINKAATQHLYMKNIPIISIDTTLNRDAIRIWDKILKQVQAYKSLMEMGVIDKYIVGRELGYTPPEEGQNKGNSGSSNDTSYGRFLMKKIHRFLRYARIYKTPLHAQINEFSRDGIFNNIWEGCFDKVA